MRELPGPNSPAAVGWGRQGSALALRAPVPALGRGRGGTGSGDCPQCLWAACLQDRAGLGILGTPFSGLSPQPKAPLDGAGHCILATWKRGGRSPPASGAFFTRGLICCLGSGTPSLLPWALSTWPRLQLQPHVHWTPLALTDLPWGEASRTFQTGDLKGSSGFGVGTVLGRRTPGGGCQRGGAGSEHGSNALLAGPWPWVASL